MQSGTLPENGKPEDLEIAADGIENPMPFSFSVAPEAFQTLVQEVAAIVFDRLGDRPEYMTTEQVASYLRWPPKRIDNLCAQGRIPYHKDLGRRIFVRQEIDEWVRRLEGPTVQDALALAY